VDDANSSEGFQFPPFVRLSVDQIK